MSYFSRVSQTSNTPVSVFVCAPLARIQVRSFMWLFFYFCCLCSCVFCRSIYIQIVLQLTNRSGFFLLSDFLRLRLNTWHSNTQRCQTPPASLPWLMTLSTFNILKSDLCLSMSSVYYQCVTAVSSPSYFCDTQQMECECVWMFVCVCGCMTLASESSLQPCCISR